MMFSILSQHNVLKARAPLKMRVDMNAGQVKFSSTCDRCSFIAESNIKSKKDFKSISFLILKGPTTFVLIKLCK